MSKLRYFMMIMILTAMLIATGGCANEEMLKLKIVEWECAEYQIRPIYVPVGKDFELQDTNVCVNLVRK